MKKLFIISVLFFCLCELFAQDKILLKNGTELKVNVTEITDTHVLYKELSGDKNLIHSVEKKNVFMITYQNGEKETFSLTPAATGGGVDDTYPYPPVSRTYQPGDLFDEGGVRGIVFYVEEDGRHGLIVSLKETSGIANTFWLRYSGHDTQWNFDTFARDFDDGWKNVAIIRHFIEETGLSWENFPAFKWCSDLGSGWYLPSYRELRKLFLCYNGYQEAGANFQAQKDFNNKLKKAGGKRLSEKTYRSSTEEDLTYAYSFNFSGFNTNLNLLTKIGYANVRAVHKF